MLTTITRHDIAHAAAADVVNARICKDRRTSWTAEDYAAAVREYHRINPCPKGAKCKTCRANARKQK